MGEVASYDDETAAEAGTVSWTSGGFLLGSSAVLTTAGDGASGAVS